LDNSNQFTYPDATTGQDIIVTHAQFSKLLRNGATLASTVWIMTTEGATITWNGVDIPVPVDSVKMSFNITDCPFQSGSNRLSVGVKMEGYGGKKHPVVKRRHHIHNLQFGIGILESITSALYDYTVPGPVEVNVGPVEDNTVSIDYVFYAFNKDVQYDPVFYISEGMTLYTSSFSLVLLIGIALFLSYLL